MNITSVREKRRYSLVQYSECIQYTHHPTTHHFSGRFHGHLPVNARHVQNLKRATQRSDSFPTVDINSRCSVAPTLPGRLRVHFHSLETLCTSCARWTGHARSVSSAGEHFQRRETTNSGALKHRTTDHRRRNCIYAPHHVIVRDGGPHRSGCFGIA